MLPPDDGSGNVAVSDTASKLNTRTIEDFAGDHREIYR